MGLLLVGRARRWSAFVTLAGAAACGSGDDGAAIDAGPGAAADAGTGSVAGLIEVLAWTDLDTGRTGAGIRAEFGQRRPPSQVEEDRLSVVQTAGECRLLRRLPPTCQDGCDWACFPDGTCQDDRGALDAGVLTVTGTSAGPLTSEFPYVPTSLPALFAEVDATIRVDATGAAVPAFSVEAPRPPALILDAGARVVPLRDDAPTVLRWPAAAHPDARFALRIGSPYGHAGSSEFVLACDGPDLGEVTIDPALAAAMPPLAVPNCVGLSCRPAALRRSVDVAAVHPVGQSTLRVGDVVWFWAEH
ncbi:MAG: hypothetical protein KBG28_30685 [Kofleriaceae bacterium]|nr:hypothetical protein [Kofleriaceae bacterium]